jgi:hypothetical protein
VDLGYYLCGAGDSPTPRGSHSISKEETREGSLWVQEWRLQGALPGTGVQRQRTQFDFEVHGLQRKSALLVDYHTTV